MKKITNVYFTLFLFAFAIGSMNMVFGTEKVLAYSDGGGSGGNGGCCGGGGRGPDGNDRDRPVKTCTNGATNYPGCNKCPAGKVYKNGKCVNPPKECPYGYVLKNGKCKKVTYNCGTSNCGGSGGQGSNYGNQNNGNGVQSVYQSYVYNYTNNYINNITNNYITANTWYNKERTHGR
jgi:hypothetical protein